MTVNDRGKKRVWGGVCVSMGRQGEGTVTLVIKPLLIYLRRWELHDACLCACTSDLHH